jgi:hypothetical protein
VLGPGLIGFGLSSATIFDGTVCAVALAFIGIHLLYTYCLKQVPYGEVEYLWR